MKNKKIFLGIMLTFFINTAFSDSLKIENPNEFNIKIYYSDNLVLNSNNKFINDERHPNKNEKEIRVIVDNGNILKKTLMSSADRNSNSKGCNYSMIITKNNGWKVDNVISESSCSPSENHYDPAKESITYTIINKSPNPVYPAFSVNKSNSFVADSISDFIQPNESRKYDIKDKFWRSIGIKNGKKVQTAIFEPFEQEYIKCSQLELVDKSKNYIFHEDGKCTSIK
ncbi:hypothetical protein QE177_14785 (plasmid) [Arsenophonus sp. aPb]|uniref:hypothetical protein n=1 Tax=Arsenophonus sp. aPb TaxID=3041619 RepID=UPI00246953AB|nr:hypothetical protein [Arsenophonus sp. aPb]WGL99779.1 hypothetical protein QE177_14785 [Arsenophonus sp. aPb]